MSNSQEAYMALEKALADDASGQVRNQLKDDFLRRAQEVRVVINRGVPPERYQKLVKYTQALESAAQVVDDMWQRWRR